MKPGPKLQKLLDMGRGVIQTDGDIYVAELDGTRVFIGTVQEFELIETLLSGEYEQYYFEVDNTNGR